MSQTIIVTWTTVTETDYRLAFETDNPENIVNILEDGDDNHDPEAWLATAEEGVGKTVTVVASRDIERKNIEHSGSVTWWPEGTRNLIDAAGRLCIDLDLANPQHAEYLRAQVELIADSEYVKRFGDDFDSKRGAIEAAILLAAASYSK